MMWPCCIKKAENHEEENTSSLLEFSEETSQNEQLPSLAAIALETMTILETKKQVKIRNKTIFQQCRSIVARFFCHTHTTTPRSRQISTRFKKIVIGTLPMPLVVGSVIEVNGEVLVQTIRFSLTLTCGPGLLDDLALYFSPRFDQNIVIRNSRLRGHWGEEECTAPVRNPFRNGAKFQVMILSTATEFMVAVNGIHFCAYRFRTLPGKVETIQVHGNVLTEAIAYGMVGYYPVLREGLADPVITLSPLRPLSEIFSDVVSTPITAILSSGFVPENELEIVGRVKILPISFSIKLQTSVNTWPSPDILLDISPIFRNGSGYTIMNSFSRGKWRRGSKKPLYFMPGRPFSIKIAAQQDEYIVKVDGVNLASYKYMHNPRKVKCLKIEGDVKIKEINIT